MRIHYKNARVQELPELGDVFMVTQIDYTVDNDGKPAASILFKKVTIVAEKGLSRAIDEETEEGHSKKIRLAIQKLQLPTREARLLARALECSFYGNEKSPYCNFTFVVAPDITQSLDEWIFFIDQVADEGLFFKLFSVRSVEKLREAIRLYREEHVKEVTAY